MRSARILHSCVWLLLCGCSSSGASTTAPDSGSPEDHVFGGDRPVSYFRSPDGADPKQPVPLVMVLHGYSAGGYAQVIYLRLERLVNEKKILLVAPDGKVDSKGNRFWNAVDDCCDFDKTGVDDVKYLTGLVDEIASVWNVDRKRVYLVGHSNGGAMSYRLGCDAASKFAAIVTLAPPFYADFSKCNPSEPVSVRHMHGTKDTTVPYEGGKLGVGGLPTPSARAIAEGWAKWDGCSATADESAKPIDFDRSVAGEETTIAAWKGCKANALVELWSIGGAGHIPPDLSADLPYSIWSFFETHPKP